ncbi:MAG: hypothetical protein EBR12_07890, partial [Proteobacteria bacterium]|nr:hypothetical protein [Pseudomonadota bacterium]
MNGQDFHDGRQISVPLYGAAERYIFLSKHGLAIFEQEPRVQQSIKDGVDVVMFSGDKLFGSVQSGIIAGKNELINSIKNFSIFRTYRCSDMVLYELQKT